MSTGAKRSRGSVQMQEIRKRNGTRVVDDVETVVGNFVRKRVLTGCLRIGVTCTLEDARTTRRAAQFCIL